jgi:hypothetical protein
MGYRLEQRRDAVDRSSQPHLRSRIVRHPTIMYPAPPLLITLLG